MGIPRGPEDVTPAWLGSVLNTDVLDVEVTPIGTGQTGATYRVSATYQAEQPDLPNSFAIKLSAQDDAVRERVALGYRSEVEFYSRIADKMRIPIPRAFHCDISDDGADVVLLLADMAPAVQGDQIAGCTPAEARLAVEALAGLHGPSWCDPVWMDLPSIAMPKPGDDAAAQGLGEISKMAADIVIDRLGSHISAAGSGNPGGRNVFGDPVVDGRTEAVRADARRLPARQHAVRSRPDTNHRGGLADRRNRPSRTGPRVLHRDQPRTGDSVRDRA